METVRSPLQPSVAVTCAIGLVLAGIAQLRAQTSPEIQPAVNRQSVSIGDALRHAKDVPLHILYVHGIGATGPNDSYTLRLRLCKALGGCPQPDGESLGSERADQGVFALNAMPPALTYLGAPVWQNLPAWSDSAPFVVHYRLAGKHERQTILLDEINWWPLVFPLKCNDILQQEKLLAGTDGEYLSDCAKQIPPVTFPPQPTSHGSAVLFNRKLKVDLMDWGFSDALMSVGPMQQLMVEGIRQLLVKSVNFSKNQGQPLSAANGSASLEGEYIVVSHSLGSFLMFAALNLQNWNAPPVGVDISGRAETFRYLRTHISQVYFFANQVPLLELAMLGGQVSPSSSTAFATPAGDAREPSAAGLLAQTTQTPTANVRTATYVADLESWAAERRTFAETQSPPTELPVKPQIVAWSDRNDLLSWEVPDIPGVDVVNLHPRNSVRWLWLFEDPAAAHDNYATNPAVIHALLEPKLPAHPQE